METPHTQNTAILYQNAAQTITLIDIPRSISLAQGTPDSPHTKSLYCSPPPKKPYASTEPKSEKARANVLRMTEQTNDVFLGDFLRQALDEIGRTWKSDWCLQRIISPFKQPRHNETRKASDPKTLDRSINPDDLAEGALEPEPQLIILEENRRTWQTEPPLVLPPNSPAGVTPFQNLKCKVDLFATKTCVLPWSNCTQSARVITFPLLQASSSRKSILPLQRHSQWRLYPSTPIRRRRPQRARASLISPSSTHHGVIAQCVAQERTVPCELTTILWRRWDGCLSSISHQMA